MDSIRVCNVAVVSEMNGPRETFSLARDGLEAAAEVNYFEGFVRCGGERTTQIPAMFEPDAVV